MYPSPEELEEVGRVTIAGSRIDVALSHLWWQLSPDLDPDKLRTVQGAQAREAVGRLTRERLSGELREEVLQVLRDIEPVVRGRNEVVHQDWILRGEAGFDPVSDLIGLDQDGLNAYVEAKGREARPSSDWQKLPSRSRQLQDPESIEESLSMLRQLESELRGVHQRIDGMVFRVASARVAGIPAGWVEPELRARLTATYTSGRLVLSVPATGAEHSVLPLNDFDSVEALELMEGGHDVDRWDHASREDLDTCLRSHGWQRVKGESWSVGDGSSATVESS